MAVEAQHIHHFDREFAESQCNDMSLSQKRQRDCDVSSSVRQHVADVDCLVLQHYQKIRAEMERRRQFEMQVSMLVEERALKKLRAKDEEIERIKKLNWALDESIKKLITESQIWKYLAQTNEATANALRGNLERALAEQARIEDEKRTALAAADDDAGSCCGDNLRDGGGWGRVCRSCSADEPSVMLLPCRHLCLCRTCATATDSCPICKCRKSGSVNVNLS